MIDVYEDSSVRVSLLEREVISSNVCVCFTGIGHALGGIDVQKEEFTKIKGFCRIIFVTDKDRSWGNGIDIFFIVSLLRPYLFGKRVFLLGNSMGGFLSIVFSRYLLVDVCVAFSSQYSVDDEVVKGETRWKKYINKIKYIKHKKFLDILMMMLSIFFFMVKLEMRSDIGKIFLIWGMLIFSLLVGRGMILLEY